MSRLKHVQAKEVQEVLRKHFNRPKDCYAVSFSAQVNHDLPSQHNVVGTLYLDHDDINLNQLETRLDGWAGKSNSIVFMEGNRKINVYHLFDKSTPEIGDVVRIVDKNQIVPYRVTNRIFDFTSSNIICYCEKG